MNTRANTIPHRPFISALVALALGGAGCGGTAQTSARPSAAVDRSTERSSQQESTRANAAEGSAEAPHAETPMFMIDMLTLQDGVDRAQADTYFSRIAAPIQRHGLTLVRRFDVRQKMAGSVEPQIVNIWSVARPDTMPSVMGDPDYQEHVAFRDATFDMGRAEMFMVRATVPLSETNASMLFVDMLALRSGVDPEQADEYFRAIEPVVASHGLVPIARFEVIQRMQGTLSTRLINLWTMASPDTMPNIMGDENYTQHVPLRNRTFDMESAVMLVIAPAS